AEQVDILLAGLGDNHRTLAAHQCEPRCAVVVHHGLRPALDQRHDGTTMVPNPSEVNTSSRIEWATRPSTTCAAGTPPCTARRHASILGTTPASNEGNRSASDEAPICETRLVASGQRS